MVKKYLFEFRDFLKKYALIGMALAFMMGAATKDVAQSLVNDIIMPLLIPVNGETWQEATLTIGNIVIRYGNFLAALLNFIILALVVFFIAKFFLKEEEVKKK